MTISSGKPRLYLDVDNTINVARPDPDWGPMEQGYARTNGYKYLIRWAPKMIEAFNNLDVEIVMLTTWTTDSLTEIVPLVGLKNVTRALEPLSGKVSWPTIIWKKDALVADQERDPSPFAWFDDEVYPEYGEQETARELGGYAPDFPALTGPSVAILENTNFYFQKDSKFAPQA